MMQEYISSAGDNFLDDEDFCDTIQKRSDVDDPLPFKGDSELHPPLAWTWMYRGIRTYGGLYPYLIPDAVRRWGYVMWDAARLECTDAKKVLMEQLNLKDSDLGD